MKTFPQFFLLPFLTAWSAQATADVVNVAPLGKATQSSTHRGAAASRAIDGDTNGGWQHRSISHTELWDQSPWWALELQEPSLISKIVLWNRTDCCSNRLSDFRVRVSDDSSSEVFMKAFFTDGASYPDTGQTGFAIELPPGSWGRCVRIDLLPNLADVHVLSLAEVEVLAVVGHENGDANGDGGVDISDAVYLLNALFLGGPQPIPVATTSKIVTRTLGLPDSGQLRCYDSASNESDCRGNPQGQDGFYVTGCPSWGRFIDNGDGTVRDTCTGLVWQQALAGPMPWCDALSYCADLTLGEGPSGAYDDWRLPNARELQSIFNYGRYGPATDPVFGDPSSYLCWSSTTATRVHYVAWAFEGADGSVYPDGRKQLSYFIRAVRGGQDS